MRWLPPGSLLVVLGGGTVLAQSPDPVPHHAQAELHQAVTDDGAQVTLRRYAAEGPPVLVVHGISSNANCWDLDQERSLGLALQRAGLDAWLLDLRGHGASTHDSDGRPQRAGWSIDHYGHHDLPAAIATMRAETGYDRVGYVGHSLGGMVGAIYAGTYPGGDDSLFAMVAVGSPMDFSDPDPVVSASLTLARLTVLPTVPSEVGGRLRVAVGEDPPLPVDDWVDAMLFNDLSPDAAMQMYLLAASPLSRGELQQLGITGAESRFLDSVGEVDYRDSLASVRTPTLVIAGRADQIAPVDRVLGYYTSVGAEEKRFVVAGRAAGFAADYGHIDLALGDHAAEEIHPLIVDWLQDAAEGTP